jgi:glutamate synthase (NADPH/NADH) large chain
MLGAMLDRNGLRPCRWYLTDDDTLVLSSEVGVLDIPPEHIVKKSRLQPGRMLLADTVQGRLVGDDELKLGYARSSPTASGWTRIWCIWTSSACRISVWTGILRSGADRLYKAFGYYLRGGQGQHTAHGPGRP